jgi:hypothetical protein
LIPRPTLKQQKGLEQTNWPQTIDQIAFRAIQLQLELLYPLWFKKLPKSTDTNENRYSRTVACGEMVGGLFFMGILVVLDQHRVLLGRYA